MPPSVFVELASALVESMGQRLDAAKPVPEGLVLRTNDGFLFAFLEDPTRVSLESVRRLFDSGEGAGARAVVFTAGHLPLAIAADVVHRGGTVVEGARFSELARQLGLEAMLGEEPRPAVPGTRRLLPSALQLDAIVHRARTWLEWGVPALALRFYRQASELKPEFLPARVGIGRSLLALGLLSDADRVFEEILSAHPDGVEARMGKAAVLGARSLPREEVEVYRTLLAEDEARTEVRAHLVAALADLGDWAAARVEIEAMLARTPEEPQLRFLHSVALARTGSETLAEEEREEARRLGLSFERESALCLHLGLPAPPRREPSTPPPAPRPPEPPVEPAGEAPESPGGTGAPAASRRNRKKRTTRARAGASPRKGRVRKRK